MAAPGSSNNLFHGLLGSGPGDEDEPQYLEAGGPSLYDRARAAVGMQPTRAERAIDSVCPSMSFKQRCYGFGICFVLGILLSFGSIIYFRKLLAGQPAPFAINYTLGNLIARPTGFLVGPKTQLGMSSPTLGCGADLRMCYGCDARVSAVTLHHAAAKVPSRRLCSHVLLFSLCHVLVRPLLHPYGRRMQSARQHPGRGAASEYRTSGARPQPVHHRTAPTGHHDWSGLSSVWSRQCRARRSGEREGNLILN